ncbi:MAG: DmsE family decaheme c-type cytochrome [Desulfovibrionaceae bacterium]|nr:DmsE family decaheme c-type cytochrome [Desulfovibrionaceae bacterium]
MKTSIWRKVAIWASLLIGLASVAQASEYGLSVRRPQSSVGSVSPAVPSGQPAVEERKRQDGICTKCHDETETKPILAIYQTPHGVSSDGRTPSCQACHGESKKHLGGNVDGTGRPPPDMVFGTNKRTTAGFVPNDHEAQSETCLNCHKAGMRMRWPGSQHQANDLTCANCHPVHNAKDPVLVKDQQPAVCFTCHKEQRAQIKQISAHPIDANKLVCSDCHNPHGSPGPKLLAKNTVNETCFTCHAEKRGPFLWEHQPATEECTNCHTPHGSNITPLLKSRAPFLCDECHDGPHVSTQVAGPSVTGLQGGGVAAGGNPSTLMVGRACMNCHVMVHGSNSPAGAFLQR